MAGVDIISQDITQPWYANGAVINEVNYAPLLGGGDISRRHIKEYLSRILKDNGRIPLYIMVGGEDAWTRGMAQWRDLVAKGVQAYLTDEERTLDAQGQSCRMATHSLNDRVQGLLIELDVGALVIVARSAHDARSIRAISPWINWREVVAPLI